jgi:hypothetical protein
MEKKKKRADIVSPEAWTYVYMKKRHFMLGIPMMMTSRVQFTAHHNAVTAHVYPTTPHSAHRLQQATALQFTGAGVVDSLLRAGAHSGHATK